MLRSVLLAVAVATTGLSIPACAAESVFSGTYAAPCARYNGKLEPINPGSWITQDDYPQRALREERGGVVQYRLTVAKTGRVSKVRIISAAWPDLAVATSNALLRRARFRPLMRKCTPIAGFYSGSIRWIIPSG